MITRVSDEVVTYLRLPYADDGTQPTLARETYVETIRDVYGLYELYLTRRPIASITSVVEAGTTLTIDVDYQVNKRLGALERIESDGSVTAWNAEKVVVTYAAGYLLPNDDARDLPYEIEEAVIYSVSARLSDLNPTVGEKEVRSESLDGVYSATYQSTDVHASAYGSGGLPTRARALLASHRNIMV